MPGLGEGGSLACRQARRTARWLETLAASSLAPWFPLTTLRQSIRIDKHLRQPWLRRTLWTALVQALLLATAFCAAQPSTAAAEPDLSPLQVVSLINAAEENVQDAAGWADDILLNLHDLGLPQNKENVCATIAIIDQESGFFENPTIANSGLVVAAAEAKIEQNPQYQLYFSIFPGVKSIFLQRLATARTERDLDLAFRYVADSILTMWGIEFAIQISGTGLTVAEFIESRNDIRTIGSMQVSVSSALDAETRYRGRPLNLEEIYLVRDFLYTRSGGLYNGIRQLLGYQTGYSRKIHRFADYNAGRYSSRNAAFQSVVAALSGGALSLDGDLLIYERRAFPSRQSSATELALREIVRRFGLQMTDAQLRADLMREKQYSFIETQTFRQVQELYTIHTAREAPFALIPKIRLHSIKLTRPLDTEWYATSVNQRYQSCVGRVR